VREEFPEGGGNVFIGAGIAVGGAVKVCVGSGVADAMGTGVNEAIAVSIWPEG